MTCKILQPGSGLDRPPSRRRGTCSTNTAARRLEHPPDEPVADPVHAGQAQRLAAAGIFATGQAEAIATSQSIGELSGVEAFNGATTATCNRRTALAADFVVAHRQPAREIRPASRPSRHNLAVIVHGPPGTAGGQVNRNLFAGQKHVARMSRQGFRDNALGGWRTDWPRPAETRRKRLLEETSVAWQGPPRASSADYPGRDPSGPRQRQYMPFGPPPQLAGTLLQGLANRRL